MGPLRGIRVIEMAGLGPAPFCAMLLADLGADVIRVDRPPASSSLAGLDRLTCRNRRSLGLNLKDSRAIEILLQLVQTADVLIEGMRPGVAERLGFGPDVCRDRNRRLVYARMTGWGQQGPLADRSGHDINYIALSGVLDAIGPSGEAPVPPLNLVADFGGGALYLALGILAAITERERSGQGQVVDAAMVDGAASLMTMFYELRHLGLWSGERGGNLLDGGAPFYGTYATADGGYMAVGALEPQFFAELVERLGIDVADLPPQYDPAGWPELRRRLTAAFATRSRREWEEAFAASDACVAPVLSMGEAPEHPHNRARETFVAVGGVTQAAPAPRFSRSAPPVPGPAPQPGEHTTSLLVALGFDRSAIEELRENGAIF